MIETSWLIPLLPLLGTILVAVFGRWLKEQSHWPVIIGAAGAAVCSFMLMNDVSTSDHDGPHHVHIYQWMSTGIDADQTLPGDPANLTTQTRDTWLNVSFRVDSLTAVMLVTVTFISTLVIIFSRGYMHGDSGYARFFAFLGLFVFSMAVLVLAGNFLLLYLGWELVGLCSYLLIGFWYAKPEAAAAAKKAFLVNRIGDFGFALGIFFIYLHFGTLEYDAVFAAAPRLAAIAPNMITIICLLLFCGAVGKSAQLPLYVWLPDAMEGPTPVSALIHAATMVTAGVYMVARCGALFAQSAVAMTVVAIVGGATALFAATIALCQYDMKRILAYSTVSQLGYMFLGLGVLAPASAIFHLFTHAFFKALLFLASGSVMHAMGNVIDIRRIGGLRRIMPITYLTFLVGSLALAGLAPFSGFFSKDEIIAGAFHFESAMVPGLGQVLGVVGLLTALLTAFYTFRLFFGAFHGPKLVPEEAGHHAHESPAWMTGPLVVLAVGALTVGAWFGWPPDHGAFHRFLEPSLHAWSQFGPEHVASGHAHPEHALDTGHSDIVVAERAKATVNPSFAYQWSKHGLLWLMATATTILGIIAAASMYASGKRLSQLDPDTPPRGVAGLLYNKYFVDELYDLVIVRPLRFLGVLCTMIDKYVIDTIVYIVALVPQIFGFAGRTTQRGALQGYTLSMVLGMVILLVLTCWWALVR